MEKSATRPWSSTLYKLAARSNSSQFHRPPNSNRDGGEEEKVGGGGGGAPGRPRIRRALRQSLRVPRQPRHRQHVPLLLPRLRLRLPPAQFVLRRIRPSDPVPRAGAGAGGEERDRGGASDATAGEGSEAVLGLLEEGGADGVQVPVRGAVLRRAPVLRLPRLQLRLQGGCQGRDRPR